MCENDGVLDINGGELLVLGAVAVVVLGPERLPEYAAQLGRLVREARTFARGAREQVRSEMGPEFDDIDWKSLDPRRYDPRRIVRDALLDDGDLFGVSDSAPNVPPAMRPSAAKTDAKAEATTATGNPVLGPMRPPMAVSSPAAGADENPDDGSPASRPTYDLDAT